MSRSIEPRSPNLGKKRSAHSRRVVARGLIRVDVQVAKTDVGLIRAVAKTLRGKSDRVKALRLILDKALVDSNVETAFDVFGSDLPDETFEGIFDQQRFRRETRLLNGER